MHHPVITVGNVSLPKPYPYVPENTTVFFQGPAPYSLCTKGLNSVVKEGLQLLWLGSGWSRCWLCLSSSCCRHRLASRQRAPIPAELKHCLLSWDGEDTSTCTLLPWQRIGNLQERAGVNSFLRLQLNQLKIHCQSPTYTAVAVVRFDT